MKNMSFSAKITLTTFYANLFFIILLHLSNFTWGIILLFISIRRHFRNPFLHIMLIYKYYWYFMLTKTINKNKIVTNRLQPNEMKKKILPPKKNMSTKFLQNKKFTNNQLTDPLGKNNINNIKIIRFEYLIT